MAWHVVPPASMPNVAAVDCGTLSTRLLVAAPDGGTLVRLARITGLGEGVERSGALAPQAIERALGALRDYRGVMDQHQVGAVTMVGTSALRDASNRADFAGPASATVGAPLQLLAGEEEARISFDGATAELSPLEGPWLVADIGGGSTELVVGPVPYGARSLDLGCARVSERFFAHDPPRASELHAARSWLARQYRLAWADAPTLRAGRALVGLAGTVSALACYDQGLPAYDRQAVHHYRLSRHAVERALDELAAKPAAQRAGLPGIEAARAPSVVGGALVLASLMGCFGFEECLVSEADILDGLVLSLISRSWRSGVAG